jgi:glutathione synthase/RimK-type ligase-like ATP-grasp enzyme
VEHCVIVGVPHERIKLFQQARRNRQLQPATLLSYTEALLELSDHITADTTVRFESVDDEVATNRTFLQLGAEIPDPNEPQIQRVSATNARTIQIETGQIKLMRQRYLGQCEALKTLQQIIDREAAVTMNTAAGINTTNDKRWTHSVMMDNAVDVPASLGHVTSFEQIADRIGWVRNKQIMIKTNHGSGATGAIAMRTDGTRWHAFSTAYLGSDGQLWNSAKVRQLTSRSEIAALTNAVCEQVVHVEAWIPKASVAGCRFDLRVVVIGGVARHVLARTSKQPFTNLHLGAERGDVLGIKAMIGDDLWNRALRIAEKAVSSIGGLLYAGVDVLIPSDLSGPLILEVNGFGDWHDGVLVDGMSTYEWEIAAAMSTHKAASKTDSTA